jgi:hypothetical protein
MYHMSHRPSPKTVIKLAAAAEVDPRTVTKAINLGIDAIHGSGVRERLIFAFRSLGIEVPREGQRAA